MERHLPACPAMPIKRASRTSLLPFPRAGFGPGGSHESHEAPDKTFLRRMPISTSDRHCQARHDDGRTHLVREKVPAVRGPRLRLSSRNRVCRGAGRGVDVFWSDPRAFGTNSSSAATNTAHGTVRGGAVGIHCPRKRRRAFDLSGSAGVSSLPSPYTGGNGRQVRMKADQRHVPWSGKAQSPHGCAHQSRASTSSASARPSNRGPVRAGDCALRGLGQFRPSSTRSVRQMARTGRQHPRDDP